MTAAVLIDPNSKLFGSKLHATKFKKPALRWLFLYLPQRPVLARVWGALLCSGCRRCGRFHVFYVPQTSLFSGYPVPGSRMTSSIHAGLQAMVVRKHRQPDAHQTDSHIELPKEITLLIPVPRQFIRFQPAHTQRFRLPPVENITHQCWR